jgi:hypothetical protein
VIQERGSQGSSLVPPDPDDSLTVLKNKKEGYNIDQCCGSGNGFEFILMGWIRIQEGKNYSEKKKIMKKIHVFKYWMFSIEG